MRDFKQEDYWRARQEHALYLRLEGLRLREIGARMGVHKERARQMILRAGLRLGRAMRHARFRLEA